MNMAMNGGYNKRGGGMGGGYRGGNGYQGRNPQMGGGGYNGGNNYRNNNGPGATMNRNSFNGGSAGGPPRFDQKPRTSPPNQGGQGGYRGQGGGYQGQQQQQQQQQNGGVPFSRFNPNAACFEPNKPQNGPGSGPPQAQHQQQQQAQAAQQQHLLPDASVQAAMTAANYGVDQKRSRFSPYNMNFANMPPPAMNQQQAAAAQQQQQQQQQLQTPQQQQQQQQMQQPQAYGQYSSMSSSMATVSLNGGAAAVASSYRAQYAVPTQAAPYMMANGGDIFAYPPPPLPVQN